MPDFGFSIEKFPVTFIKVSPRQSSTITVTDIVCGITEFKNSLTTASDVTFDRDTIHMDEKCLQSAAHYCN